MKILMIHNRYQQRGGEDYVFESEGELLSQYGHVVDRLIFDNKSLRTLSDKLKAASSIVYNRNSRKQTEKRIKAFKPDIIHVHNFWPLASPSVFYAAAQYNIPVIHTLHNFRLICPSATLFYKGGIYEASLRAGFPFDAIKKGVYRNSSWQTAALAATTFFHHLAGTWKEKISRYIVLNSFVKDKFTASKLNIPPAKLVIKPNFVKDHGIGEPVREDFLLYIGRLTEEKGISTLLHAAAKLNFNLTIMGDGPLAAEVKKASHDRVNIRYVGLREKEDVISALKRCKALICPSVWYEGGLPLTILEAFSTATPVIASRLGSMTDVLSDRFNGLHFEPGNATDLANKVQELRDNNTLAENLSKNARRTYEEKFTAEVSYKALIDIYDGAIAAHHPRLQYTARNTTQLRLIR